jgi:hypothetical protein
MARRWSEHDLVHLGRWCFERGVERAARASAMMGFSPGVSPTWDRVDGRANRRKRASTVRATTERVDVLRLPMLRTKERELALTIGARIDGLRVSVAPRVGPAFASSEEEATVSRALSDKQLLGPARRIAFWIWGSHRPPVPRPTWGCVATEPCGMASESADDVATAPSARPARAPQSSSPNHAPRGAA